MKTQFDIIDCGLPLKIQKLYIKRLKHMIERWEYSNFCGHCPVNKRFECKVLAIKQLDPYHWRERPICNFCLYNVGLSYGCPCNKLGPKKALKRAKDFIERFERKYTAPTA